MAVKHVVTDGLGFTVPSYVLTDGIGNFGSGGGGGATSVTASLVADDKVYDATTTATGTLSLPGVDPGHDVTLTYTSITFATAAVGTGKTVTANGLALTGADASLYALTASSATDTADITARAITITADNLYKANGDPDPTLTATVTSGAIQGSDTHSGALSRAAGESDGTYAISQNTYTYGSNYTETYVAGVLTIFTPGSGGGRDRRKRGMVADLI